MVNTTATALVVDDNEEIRKQLSHALDHEGIESDSAADGDEAIKKCGRRNYSVVITDLRMPKFHGHALVVSLLKQAYRPKIVIFTGVTEPRIATDLLTRGVDAIVYKPVNYFDLATKVKNLLPPPADSSPDPVIEDALLPESLPEEMQAEDALPTDAVSPEGQSLLNLSSVRAKKPPAQKVFSLRERVEEKLKQSSVVDPWIKVSLQSLDWRRYRNPCIEIPCFLREPAYAPTNGENYQPDWGVVMNETVVALGIGEGNLPQGDPFKMIMHTLSRDEMSFVYSEPLEYTRIALVWRTRDRSRVVAMLENIRCRDHATICEVVGDIVW